MYCHDVDLVNTRNVATGTLYVPSIKKKTNILKQSLQDSGSKLHIDNNMLERADLSSFSCLRNFKKFARQSLQYSGSKLTSLLSPAFVILKSLQDTTCNDGRWYVSVYFRVLGNT